MAGENANENIVLNVVVNIFDETSTNTLSVHFPDIILAGFWIAFFFAGVIFQLYCEKGRAPFPPANNNFCCQNANEPHRPPVGNEREPLLPDNPPAGTYGTVGRAALPTQQPPYPYYTVNTGTLGRVAPLTQQPPYPYYTVNTGYTSSVPMPK